MMILKDRVAIITGSARGIGKGIALKFVDEGASVVINGTTPEKVDETVQMIRGQGGTALGIAADITKKKEVEELVESVTRVFGKLDVLVNNAGNSRDAMLIDMTEEQWDDVLNVHLKGAFLCTQASVKKMRENKYGRVINISSAGGFFGNIGMVNYVTSKAGLFGFTLAVAKELAMWSRKEQCNITCNCITPGYNPTRMTEHVPEKIARKFQDAILMGRVADSKEDIGGVVSFLASEAASYITGALVAAGGGQHLNLPRIA
ncbi:SDR family NAD(P)-dependent oxidoreductase [Thermodesulfobacteriota bacterium]